MSYASDRSIGTRAPSLSELQCAFVKYLVKDAEKDNGELRLIDPELYARIYKGLEGVRTIATSRHFTEQSDRSCVCEACGSPRVDRRVKKPADKPQGGEGAPPDGSE